MRNLEDEIYAIKMEEASLKRKLNGKLNLERIALLHDDVNIKIFIKILSFNARDHGNKTTQIHQKLF